MNQSDNSWTTIGRLSDLVVGSGVGARYGDRQVAVFLIPELADRVFVVDNYCPISGVNIIARGIVGDIQGEPVVATPCTRSTSHCLMAAALRMTVTS